MTNNNLLILSYQKQIHQRAPQLASGWDYKPMESFYTCFEDKITNNLDHQNKIGKMKEVREHAQSNFIFKTNEVLFMLAISFFVAIKSYLRFWSLC